jgi:hypothetical protein
MLSAANQVFAAELCCPQGIRCSLSDCVFASNQIFATELCCPQRIRFSLLNLCCPQRIRFSLSNCVFRSESGVRCQILVVCSESGVRCRICVVHSKSGFRYLIMLTAANQVLLLKLCCLKCAACSEPVFTAELYGLQRINFCCWIVWPAANQFRCPFSTIDPWAKMT